MLHEEHYYLITCDDEAGCDSQYAGGMYRAGTETDALSRGWTRHPEIGDGDWGHLCPKCSPTPEPQLTPQQRVEAELDRLTAIAEEHLAATVASPGRLSRAHAKGMMSAMRHLRAALSGVPLASGELVADLARVRSLGLPEEPRTDER